MNNVKKITQCRLCNCPDLEEFISFGDINLANDLIKEGGTSAGKFDLTVVSCKKCGLFQLGSQVSSELMFSNYSYVTSKGLEQHFKDYAFSVVERLELEKGDTVLEIGGNSGMLSKEFQLLGMNVINVEPATNIAQISRANGINTYNEFFSRDFVEEFLKTNDRVQVVVANNVLAHLEDYHTVYDGIQNILEHNGTLVMENAYWLDTLRNNDFSQCYSEHSCYLTISALFSYFESRGMMPYYLSHEKTQCGSFRLYVNNGDVEVLDKSVVMALLEEYRFIYRDGVLLQEFKEGIQDIKNKVRDFLEQNKDKKIGLVGVTAKCVLLLEYFGISKYFFAAYDDSSLKVNCFVPGTNIKIKSMEYISECDIAFLGAFNFKDFIINRFFHLPITWVTPLPEFKVENYEG